MTATTSYDCFRARRYFPALDGIRAVAVVAVVSWHVGDSDALHWFQGGRGVEWFFALSGFLITTLALREEERDGAMAVRPFLIRRCFRIMPLYLTALVCFVVADVLVFRSPAATSGWATYWPYYLTFLQDIPINLSWKNAPFAVSWSLGVEEKFYLVWPIVGFVMIGVVRRLRMTLVMAAGLGATLLAWPRTDVARMCEPYLPILLGCVAAMLLQNRRTFERVSRFVRPATLVILALAVLAPMPAVVTGSRGYHVFYAVLISSAVGAFAVAPRVSVLGSETALWIGRRSYAVYLFHTLVIRIVEKAVERTSLEGEPAGAVIFVTALALSLVVADVLHRLVERPLISAGRRIASKPVRNAARAT